LPVTDLPAKCHARFVAAQRGRALTLPVGYLCTAPA
jgi:hypothetical protein